jgi:hypothetical protein
VSGVLQFGLLPVLMKRIDTRVVWIFMPTIMCVATVWVCLAADNGLFTITVCFCLMKIIEYSLRGFLTEMVCFVCNPLFELITVVTVKLTLVSVLLRRCMCPSTMRASF